jgi:hypothetical protein
MQKLSVAPSTGYGRGKRRDRQHARTYRSPPLLVRKPLRKTPAPPSQAGRGKFVWDHRMTGPEGGPFPGADSGLAQSAPRTSACKDVHALWLTEVGRPIVRGPTKAADHGGSNRRNLGPPRVAPTVTAGAVSRVGHII